MERDLDELALSIVMQLSDVSAEECQTLKERLVGGDEELEAAVEELLKVQEQANKNPLWHSPAALHEGVGIDHGPRDRGSVDQSGRFQPPVLDRFIPIDVLGRGGQGEVWLMLDPRIDRRVALKILQPSKKDSWATLSSFRREAEISGKLEHPNIVPVYDVTSELNSAGLVDPDSPCFVMRLFGDPRLHVAIEAFHAGNRTETDRQLLEAVKAFEKLQSPETKSKLRRQFDLFPFDSNLDCDTTLKHAVESILRDDSDAGTLTKAIAKFHSSDWSELTLRKLLARFQRVCEGVAYAHSRGVIHRDLKPDNIMLGEYGETLVADWGLAKVVGRQDRDNDRATGETLEISSENSGDGATGLGDLKGTPRYMSPEQASGRNDELTPATDIYSLGAILYRILTGRDAIIGESLKEILQHVRDGEFRPPRAVLPRVPQALEAVVLKAMSLKPADRYSSALALSSDIENWLNDEPVSAWREPLTVRARRWMKRHQTTVVSSVATLSVALISLGIVAAIVAGKNIELDQQKTVVDQQNTELSRKNDELEAAKQDADDQRGKAEANAAEALQNAKTAQLNEQKAKDREKENGQLLVNSNLGRGAEAVEDRDFLLARQAYAEALLIAETRAGASPEELAIHRTRLGMLDLVAPKLQQTVFSSVPILQAGFSPNGQKMALLQMQRGTIKLVDVATGRTLIDGFKNPGAVREFAFSPDGKKLISWAMDFDGNSIISLWDAESGRQLAKTQCAGKISRLQFSPDGAKIGVGCEVSGFFGQSGQIELRNSDSLALEGKAMETTHPVTSIAFSPDGTQIAATVPGSKSPVVVYKTDDQTKVCESGELLRHEYCDIAFSPKGTQICVASNSGAAVLLHGQTAKMIAALNNIEQLVEPTVDEFGRPLGFVRFSPDGKSVLTACGDRTARLWKSDTGQPIDQSLIHKDHVTDCCFSPDGRRIGTSCLDGMARLWNVSTGNTTAAILKHSGPIHAIEIHSDDKILTASEDQMARTWSYHSPAPIVPAAGIPPAQSVISADGGWIAGRIGRSEFQVWNSANMSEVGSAISCKHAVHLMSLTDKGTKLALAGFSDESQGLLSVVEPSTGVFIEDSMQLPGLPLKVSFSSDGRWCAVQTSTALAGKQLTIRDLQEHRSISVDLKEPDEWVWNPVVTSELFVGCRDGRVYRVQLPDAAAVLTGVDTGSAVIRNLGISRDGKLLTSTTGNEVRVWDVTNWKSVSQSLTHESEPNGAAFSSDARKLLTWSSDGGVKLWVRDQNNPDWIAAGERSHQKRVNDAAFSPDDLLIATVSDDGAATLWDATSLQSVSPPMIHNISEAGTREAQIVRFSADSRTLFTSSQNSQTLLESLHLPTIKSNLRQDPRAMESTLQPLLMQSMMQTWRWQVRAMSDSSSDVLTMSEFESGLRLDSSGRWRPLTSDEQYEVIDRVSAWLPQGWAARQYLARQAKDLDNLAESERQYALAVQAEQNDGLLWYEYSSVLYDLDKFQSALDSATKAFALGYADGRVHLVRGRSLLYLDRFEESLQELTKATETSLVPQYARLDLANCQAMLGRFDEAADSLELSFREHRKFGDEVDAVDRYRQIVLELARNKPEDFRKRLQSYMNTDLKSESFSTAFHIALAAILRADCVEDWSVVIKLADQVAAEDPQNITNQALPGCARYRAGQFADAERQLKAAIALQPPADPAKEAASPLPHYFLALSLQATNQSDAAREAITTGNRLLDQLKAGPASVPIYVRLPWHRRTIFELLKTEAESVVPAEKP